MNIEKLEGTAPYGCLLLAPAEGWWPSATWWALWALLSFKCSGALHQVTLLSCVILLAPYVCMFIAPYGNVKNVTEEEEEEEGTITSLGLGF